LTKRDVSRQESADDYPGVVADFGNKWRIITCRAGEQWILQRKSGTWEARSFCRTSDALRRVVREHVGNVEPPDLPKWIAEPARMAHSPTRTTKSRPTGLPGPSSGRLSACGRWRLWGPKLSERSLRFATLAWNWAVGCGTTDFAMPEPARPAPPIAPELLIVSSVPLVPDDADPLEIPAFLRRPIAEAAKGVCGPAVPMSPPASHRSARERELTRRRGVDPVTSGSVRR
jgi:hypothetical protein